MDYVVVSNSEIWANAIFLLIKEILKNKNGTYLVGDYDMGYLFSENLEFLIFDLDFFKLYEKELKKKKINAKKIICIGEEKHEDKISSVTFIDKKSEIEDLKRILKLDFEKENEKPNLKNRDKNILYLLCNGESNREIGEKLFLSEKTIKNDLTRIYRELGVSNRYQCMKKISEYGIDLE